VLPATLISVELLRTSEFTWNVDVISISSVNGDIKPNFIGDMMHKMTVKYDIIKRNSKYGIKIDMSCNKKRITTEAMLDLKDDYQMKFVSIVILASIPL
jgi:pentose-5-phosphate-3-epimerase